MGILDKIKALFVLNKEFNKIKEAKMKSGFRTTEFWLTALTSLLSVYGAVSGLIPQDLALKIVAGIIMVYTIARAIVKFTPTTKDDEVLAKIEAILKEKEILKNSELINK